MTLDLKAWTRDWALMSSFFSFGEINRISGKLKKLRIQNVVFCSFENRFAKSGGLAAVTTNILPYLKEINHVPNVILMTPFYPSIMDSTQLQSTGKSFRVPFNNKVVQAELYEYTWNYTKPQRGSLKEYYLKAEGLFETSKNIKDPYLYSESDKLLNDNLMRESSLFFCKAVPLALQELGIRENIVFHLQEWQTALLSLSAKAAMLNGTLESCATVQTMHNSYDSFIPWESLAGIVNGKAKQNISLFPGLGATAYQIGLQLADAPVTTVSEHYAEEFTTDILQTEYFAPHLQNIFLKSGVYGVNNGMFIELSPELSSEGNLSIDDIRKIKLKNRKALLKVLASYKPKERFGELTYKGKTISRLPDNVPIIVMSGRLDPLQKGFDILLRAIERFAEDEIKVVLTPMATRRADLDCFYEAACKCKGNLTVFAGRMEKGFSELQAGATFGLMPSIYEPFGAAVEYMANGTVNIGRSTGGLVDQIDLKCGYLYKEDAVFYTLDNIRDFVETADIVQARKANPWALRMADSLYEVLKKAVNVYRNSPDQYYKLVLNGLRKVNNFNWETNARKYFQVYEKTRGV
ncbi:MAG: glycogen/starch synthase [Nitrospirae bacterium]|nr:glycogen/starch synthase [Nitrospirota bacterium]